ncbi:MAG: hypothetical protein R3320_00740 [Nitriliruptorales bacterium]|nr:hypothetical protein [Nitriliruptorales bacterium]
MSTTTTSSRHADAPAGVNALSIGLWIALTAGVLQFTALGSDFYQVGETVRDAWFGIPHASQLVLLSALTTFTLAGFAAGGRSPVSGRTAGVLIALVGLIAALHLGYRMAVPPFRGCLTFNCGFTPNAENVTLLAGIWIAMIGNVGAIVGGIMHSASSTAKRTPANFWVSRAQTGMTPWLGVAALSAAIMVVVGYLVLPFYTVQGGPNQTWTGWMAIPHTAGLVLLMALIIIGLVIAAARDRAPMGPTALGATVAVLAFVATARTAYRIAVSPFYSGPAEGVFETGAQINLAAWIGLVFGVVTIVAGIAHAASNREVETRQHAGETSASTV